MGKTGGHKKKGSKTGTQKKSLKLSGREHRKGASTREKARQEYENLLGPEGQKFLEQFTTGEGQKQAIMNAQELLAPILQGQRRQAMNEFDQSTLPQMQAMYGGGGRSSAFNQALASARTNLEQNLYDRSAELGLNFGSQLAQQQQQAGQQMFSNRLNAAAQGQGVGLSQGNLNATTDQFVFAPKATPVLAQMAVAGTKQAVKSGMAAASGGATAAADAAGAA